ncbi:hypothetical protein GJAV_G00239740 [Gymnothorax javanicus]|nr:hypothetical protein GJAV_G00239740 [Gymnothorax javanicus]
MASLDPKTSSALRLHSTDGDTTPSSTVCSPQENAAETQFSQEVVAETLCLSRRGLKHIEYSFLKISAIKNLYLEGNEISILPGTLFSSLPNLVWLDLRHNQITQLPPEIGQHSCLKTLLLEGNPITELPLELGNVITLRALSLRLCPVVFPPQDVLCKGVQCILHFLRRALAERPVSGGKSATAPAEVPPIEGLQLSSLDCSEAGGDCGEATERLRFEQLKLRMREMEEAEFGRGARKVQNEGWVRGQALPNSRRHLEPAKGIFPDLLHWKRSVEGKQASIRKMKENQGIFEQRRKDLAFLREWRSEAQIRQQRAGQRGERRNPEEVLKKAPYATEPTRKVDKYAEYHAHSAKQREPGEKSMDSANELDDTSYENGQHLPSYEKGERSEAEAIVALEAGIEQRQLGHLIQENMEAPAEELRAGSRIPVIIDQIVNDTLVVTLSYRERSYTGILLDSNKKTGLFCLPDVATKHEESPTLRPICDVPPLQPCPEPSSETEPRPRDENALPDKTPAFDPASAPMPAPVPAGQTPFPPYFEGAPFPQPLWVRHTYGQWVPQPPPRPIKRKKRRSREPGRMTMSTIRLRPRQVLCEKCKNTLNSDEDSKDGVITAKPTKKEDSDGKETKRREEPAVYDGKRCKRDKRDDDKFPGEVVPHSPVIKISYSTPQGKGEVMKIPSRVHGSVKPFCPKQQAQNTLGDPERAREAPQEEQSPALDSPGACPATSIPKLKLSRPPLPTHNITSPKIRLKPRGAGEDSLSVYEAELVSGTRRRSPRAQPPPLPGHSEDSAEKSSLEQSSGSSGEEGDRHGDLTLLINFRKRKADSSSLSVCSSDSLDESKSFSSEGTSPELCDLAPGDDLSVSSSSSRDGAKTVPPLTVRLHTRSMSNCVTEEGHAVAVGDVVWGKIHGFPWWPARVLSITCRKGEQRGSEAWPEATVSWFGSPTTSQLSVSKLSPFRDFFRSRFNRKKKGIHRGRSEYSHLPTRSPDTRSSLGREMRRKREGVCGFHGNTKEEDSAPRPPPRPPRQWCR